MTMLRLWLQLLGLIVLGELSSSHLHRYMLSDYRRQHNAKKQLDYKPIARPEYSPSKVVTKEPGRVDQALVQLTGSAEKVKIVDILVRIFSARKYICLGTLITGQVILTASTCFRNIPGTNISVRTSKNQLIDVYDIQKDNKLAIDYDSALSFLALKEPAKGLNITVELCKYNLNSGMKIVLPMPKLGRRLRVLTVLSVVKNLESCQKDFSDTLGKNVTSTMICAKNEKRGKCENTQGIPLIYEDQICGVSVLGHNCPRFIGEDVYASILNEATYVNRTLQMVKDANLEGAIL